MYIPEALSLDDVKFLFLGNELNNACLYLTFPIPMIAENDASKQQLQLSVYVVDSQIQEYREEVCPKNLTEWLFNITIMKTLETIEILKNIFLIRIF